MIEYSIIIPTHNRQSLIKKNIEYYSNFKNITLYICDSSPEPSNLIFPENMIYYHLHKCNFAEKILTALKKINTNHVSICADDDFLIEDTIVYLINEMKSKNMIMGVGKYYGFNIPFTGFFPKYEKLKFPETNGNDKKNRIMNYMNNYFMSLWGVYQTNKIIEAYKILVQIKLYNDNFIELIIAITMAQQGKVLFTNKVIGIREHHNFIRQSWKDRHSSLKNRTIDHNIKEDIKQIEPFFPENVFKDAFYQFYNSEKPNDSCRMEIYTNSFVENIIKSHYVEEKEFYSRLVKIFNSNRKSKIILYGSGTVANIISAMYSKQIKCILDKQLFNRKLNKIDVFHPEFLQDNVKENVVLITVLGREEEIISYLKSMYINQKILRIK